MFNDSDDLMNILKQGVNKQANPNHSDTEIVEKMDDFEEGTVIVDQNEIFTEYIVDTSLNGNNEAVISEEEEVDFLESDDMSGFEVDPFGSDEMAVLKEKKGIKGIDLLQIKEIEEDEMDSDFLDDEEYEEEFEGDSKSEKEDSFEELNWGEDDSDETEEDIPDEELVLQNMYNVALEEDILLEDKEDIKKVEVKEEKVEKTIEEVVVEETENIIEENAKFTDCIFNAGMGIEEYLRANPNYREKLYVEHFFKSSIIEDALTKGIVLLKKGRFMI